MKIWEVDSIILFIAFVVPGFISIKVYDLLVPSETINSSKMIIDAIAYSSINYTILLIPILLIEINNINEIHKNLYMFFYFFTLFIFPIFLAIFWKWLRSRDFIQKNIPHPTPKPWDYIFSQRKPYWIKVTLKDGTIIGGKYAEKSFTSSSPAKEQIYLEETWIINEDGGFERIKNETEGVIIVSDEISYIEFINYNL